MCLCVQEKVPSLCTTKCLKLLPITTLLGIITAGLLTTGEYVVRLKDGEFARNPSHLPGHNFINFHVNQPTRDNYWRVYLRPGKMWFGKNMAKFSKTRHFIPVIIILSKVSISSGATGPRPTGSRYSVFVISRMFTLCAVWIRS